MPPATAGLARRCALDPAADLGIGGRFLPEASGDSLGLLRARCEEGLDRHFPRARRVPDGGGQTATTHPVAILPAATRPAAASPAGRRAAARRRQIGRAHV